MLAAIIIGVVCIKAIKSIIDKIICFRGIKMISLFCTLKNKFSKFVWFIYFLEHLNSRGIILNITHKMKQN